MKILNFIQDEATPHNNLLLNELDKNKNIELSLWYSRNVSKIYSWQEDLTNAVKKAKVYGDKKINWDLVRGIFRKNNYFFLVGWSNPTTRFMILIFFLIRTKYSMWFDLPSDDAKRHWIKNILREFYYFILNKSNSTVFCVGVEAITYFKKRGFSESRLVNLPVFVTLDKQREDYFERKLSLFKQLNINENDFIITSGSRLVKEKGYDLLIKAIYLLEDKCHLRLILCGQGEEENNLRLLIKEYKLDEQITIIPWMDIDDLRSLISNSHVFVHPARMDSFGAGSLNAMGLGVPVIASMQSGSGPDRIIDGINGWLYESEDYNRLSSLLMYCQNNKDEIFSVGKKGRVTAESWTVDHGVNIIMANLF